MEPLRSLADLQDALKAARVDYNHSLARRVSRRKTIHKSRKTAFQSVLPNATWSGAVPGPPQCVLPNSTKQDPECR